VTPPEPSSSPPVARRSIAEVLEEARRRLSRYGPDEALAAMERGALLVDIRPAAQRAEQGEIPGALVIERNLLEWRLDPASSTRIDEAAYDREVVVFCADGYTSSLAAASLQDLGIERATDLDGGFNAWVRAGHPATPGRSAAGRPSSDGPAVLDPGTPLRIETLLDIAHGRSVSLSRPAEERLAAARGTVEATLAADVPTYGLNTGLGHSRDDRVDGKRLADYQTAIVRLHAGALGRPLPSTDVRAAMAARVNSAVRGGSGLRPRTVAFLVDMLNAGVHPVVPEVGSVGASDLGHMAAIGLVMIGLGQAEFGGRLLAGAEALEAAGLEPLSLEPMEGLSLVSSNSMAIARAASVLARAKLAVETADVVAATSLEAVTANLSVIDPAVGEAKGIDGQREAIAHLRALLGGSSLDGRAPSVQDPLSFRVIPQVHGAAREFLAFCRHAVETELNASDDNPLVVASEGRMVSNGNFHPLVMALGFDALRPALTHVAMLSSRRMNHLTKLLFQGRDVAFPTERSDAFARVDATYSAAALYAEIRHLAGPASLDVQSLDLEQEDHATAAPLTVAVTDRLLGLLERVLAVEIDFATALLGRRAGGAGSSSSSPSAASLGRGVEAARVLVEAKWQELEERRPAASTAEVNEALTGLVRGGALLEAADRATADSL
jgi:histidine ammonia-lyase